MELTHKFKTEYVCRKCRQVSKRKELFYPNNIRELRARTGLSGYELARRADLSSQHLFKIDSGKINIETVTYANLQKIAAALNVEVDDLFIKSKAA